MPHTTNFSMPIIGAAASYAAITPRTTVTVNANKGVTIIIASSGAPNPAEASLFATLGGLLSYRASGSTLPNGAIATTPTLLLQPYIDDLREIATEMASGAPKPGYIIYENVDSTTLAGYFSAIAAAQPTSVLEAAWPGRPPGTTRSQLEAKFVALLGAGTTSVLIEGGTPIGDAGAGPAPGSYKILYSFLEGVSSPAVPAYLSVLPYFSSMAPVADRKLSGGNTWNGHPLITATASAPVQLDIYVRFEVYNINTREFKPVRAGTTIGLFDYDPTSPDDPVPMIDPATGLAPVTDADGLIHGRLADVRSLDIDDANSLPDFYFKAMVAGQALPWYSSGDPDPAHQFPRDWSTKGWNTVDGKPGYYENFGGDTLGTAANPLVFRIGFDFHIQFSFQNRTNTKNYYVPKGVYVELRRNALIGSTSILTTQTTVGGYANGFTFDVDGDDELFIRLVPKMDDTAIKMATVEFGVMSPVYLGWDTPVARGDTTVGEYEDASIAGKAFSVNIAKGDGSNQLYVLKVARELAIFMHSITTNPANPSQVVWPGTEITYQHLTLSFVSGMAFPVGTVFLGEEETWTRWTIFHETAHQIMWRMLDVGWTDIATWFLTGKISMYHQSNLEYYPVHALVEGWAAFIELFMKGGFEYIDVLKTPNPVDKDLGPVRKPGFIDHINRGYFVEGAFANGLRAVLQEVVNRQRAGLGLAPYDFQLGESDDGELLDPKLHNEWILDPLVRQVFNDLIWAPFQTLVSFAHLDRSSFDMTNAMLAAASPSLEPEVRGWLNAYNMAVETAVTAGLPSISSGPRAGGTSFTITGTNFVARNRQLGPIYTTPLQGGMKVLFGGVAAGTIAVPNSTTITGLTPPSPVGPGKVDVEVQLVVRGVVVSRIVHALVFEYM